MITQLDVFTPRVLSSPLPGGIGMEATDPIQIISIDGLGPVAAAVNTVQYASVDGEFYNGSNVGKRNIVLTLRLNPDWSDQTVEGLRKFLYQYFMPKNQVTLQFTSTHMAQVNIVGYVESMEPTLFSKDPVYTVSIICPKPQFVAVAPTVINGTVELLTASALQEIDYEGSLECGFVLDVTTNPAYLVNTLTHVYLQNVDVQQFIIKNPAMATTHELELSTIQGSKWIRDILVSAGTYNSLLGSAVSGSVWPTLKQGANQFRVQLDPNGTAGTAGQPWTLTYQALYGGL